MRDPMILVGYLLGGAMVVTGLLILAGLLRAPEQWDPTLGTIFGVILLLFGIYRLLMTETKRRGRVRE